MDFPKSPLQGAERPRLTGRGLFFVRVIWVIIVSLALGFFLASISPHYKQLITATDVPQTWLQLSLDQSRSLVNFGLTLQFYAAYLLVLQIIVVAVFASLSFLIFWRQSGDWMAIFASLGSLIYGVASVPLGQALSQYSSASRLLVDYFIAFGWGFGLLLFYLFPTGHFFPRWTRWLAFIVVGWILLWPLVPAINPEHWKFPLPFLTKLGWYGTGIFAQVYRYHRNTSRVEQQQTKWVVYGFTTAFIGFFLFNLPVVLLASLRENTLYRLYYLLAGYPILALLPLLLAPLSIGFACLRYRLWEIDILINRTLIYSLVTTALALLFYICVVILQWLFRLLTGQNYSEIVTAISTLAIWAAFQPVYWHIRAFIDRRFYWQKYKADRVLMAFLATLRDDAHADLTRLTFDLLAVVEQTMQPSQVSLWVPTLPLRKQEERSES
jgi:hypothetical protein